MIKDELILKGPLIWWTIPVGLLLGMGPPIAFVFLLDWLLRRRQIRGG
jgi:hypothetical protein